MRRLTALQAFRCGDRDSRRGAPAAAGDLSRSRRLEPRGLSSRPGNHFDGDRQPRSRGAAWAKRKMHLLACRVSGLAARDNGAAAGAARGHAKVCLRPLRLSEDDAIMLAAMVAGDRTYLTHSLRVGFERTGSFHMLVVSGFHLAIVAGASSGLRDGCGCRVCRRHCSPSLRRLPMRFLPASPRRCSARCGW